MNIDDIIIQGFGYMAWVISRPDPVMAIYDRNILNSFAQQLEKSSALTEKQAIVAERVLTKYCQEISTYLGVDISKALANPRYRLGKRTVNQEKSVKIVETENNEQRIALTFPFSEKLVELIKEYRKSYQTQRVFYLGYVQNSTIDWNQDLRAWCFDLREEHISWIWKNFQNLGFTFDEKFLALNKEIENIESSIENFVPMVIFENNSFKFINTHKNIPQPTSTDLLEVLFEAKKYGISTWDESIDLAIRDKSISSFTKKVIQENLGQELPKNGEKLTKNDLKDVINYMNPILVTIPGGSELESLKYFHKFLNDSGIPNDKISVLFRLDSSSGAICNEYVKENKLNNSISENIKIFCISGKVPKPLYSAGIEFEAVINLGKNSAHYTQRNLIKNHHCVINYLIDNATL